MNDEITFFWNSNYGIQMLIHRATRCPPMNDNLLTTQVSRLSVESRPRRLSISPRPLWRITNFLIKRPLAIFDSRPGCRLSRSQHRAPSTVSRSLCSILLKMCGASPLRPSKNRSSVAGAASRLRWGDISLECDRYIWSTVVGGRGMTVAVGFVEGLETTGRDDGHAPRLEQVLLDAQQRKSPNSDIIMCCSTSR